MEPGRREGFFVGSVGVPFAFRGERPMILTRAFHETEIVRMRPAGAADVLLHRGGCRMRNPLLVPDLRELIQAGETDAIVEFFHDQHPAHVAEIVEDLEPAEGDALFARLPERDRAEVLSYLDRERQLRIVGSMPPTASAAL